MQNHKKNRQFIGRIKKRKCPTHNIEMEKLEYQFGWQCPVGGCVLSEQIIRQHIARLN